MELGEDRGPVQPAGRIIGSLLLRIELDQFQHPLVGFADSFGIDGCRHHALHCQLILRIERQHIKILLAGACHQRSAGLPFLGEGLPDQGVGEKQLRIDVGRFELDRILEVLDRGFEVTAVVRLACQSHFDARFGLRASRERQAGGDYGADYQARKPGRQQQARPFQFGDRQLDQPADPFLQNVAVENAQRIAWAS